MLDVGQRGGNDLPAEEARGGAGLAKLLSPRTHLSLRSGPVQTEADRSRTDRGEGEDAGRPGGVRLQGMPACGGLQGSGHQAAGELGEDSDFILPPDSAQTRSVIILK